MRELTEIEEVAAGYDWAGLAGAMAGTAVVGGMYGLAGGSYFAASSMASSMAGGGGCD